MPRPDQCLGDGPDFRTRPGYCIFYVRVRGGVLKLSPTSLCKGPHPILFWSHAQSRTAPGSSWSSSLTGNGVRTLQDLLGGSSEIEGRVGLSGCLRPHPAVLGKRFLGSTRFGDPEATLSGQWRGPVASRSLSGFSGFSKISKYPLPAPFGSTHTKTMHRFMAPAQG